MKSVLQKDKLLLYFGMLNLLFTKFDLASFTVMKSLLLVVF